MGNQAAKGLDREFGRRVQRAVKIEDAIKAKEQPALQSSSFSKRLEINERFIKDSRQRNEISLQDFELMLREGKHSNVDQDLAAKVAKHIKM